MMRTVCMLLLPVAVVLVLSTQVFADLVASAEIVDTTGDPHRITIVEPLVDTPFSFDVWLTTNFDAVGAEMKVQSTDSSGFFELTGRTFDEAAGWGYFPLDFVAPDALTGSPDSISSQLIGCLSVDDFLAPGMMRFMTVDAVIKAGTPIGIYSLNLASINVGQNITWLDVAGIAGQTYEVEVLPVPAPGGVVLGVMGLSMVGWLRRRFTNGNTEAGDAVVV